MKGRAIHDRRRRRQLGISLAEALVAITVLALAMTVALVMHNGARRSFKVGTNLAEQQQVVRIAFDKLSRDVAMAGFNQNPDGAKLRPDEAIEAAFDTAVVLRADFDARIPADSGTPETALAGAGGAFPSVSTGNDEIVGYLLAKPDLSSSGTMEFFADVVGVPRDGAVESITTPNVAMVQNDPPYTLYRVTVDDNAATTSRIPLVDNVRSLRFTYYDGSGNVVAAPGGGEDDTSKNDRATISRVGIEIDGLTRAPDLRWRDREDSDPDTQDYRKFRLSGDVTPPNLGLFGIKDLEASLSPPSQPPPPVLHPGHCGALYIEWSPNPPQDEVARYELRWGTDPSVPNGPHYAANARYYLDGLNDATQYYVTIEAVDDSGNVSAPSGEGSATTANLNVPEKPLNVAATIGQENVVSISWDPVTENFTPSAPSADPLYPQIRDFWRYQLYRGDAPGFAADSDSLLARRSGTHYDDTHIVNCKPYYYRVEGTDSCGPPGELSDAAEGRGYTIVPPEAPSNAESYVVPGGARIVWDVVNRNVDGDPIFIENYKVFRATLGPPLTWSPLPLAFVLGEEYLDTTYDPLVPVAYKVQAYDLCPNHSADSNETQPTCEFTETVIISEPDPFEETDVGEEVEVEVQDAVGTYTLTLRYLELPSGLEVAQESPAGGPPWSTTWPAAASGPGYYRLDATVRRADGCERTTSRLVPVDL